jgi:hypothetical protein
MPNSIEQQDWFLNRLEPSPVHGAGREKLSRLPHISFEWG